MASPRSRRPGQVSLERAFSKLGIASRAQARDWIQAGRVRANGIVRRDPEFPLNPDRAVLELDGVRLEAAGPRVFILHKPRGTVTTRVDEKGRPTVFDCMAKLDLHLIAVGRLDWATSGLLILTNDTRLAHRLADPGEAVERIYVVTVRGEVNEATLEKLAAGITEGDETLRAERVELRKSSQRESHLTVALRRGKNREIRRMFEALGHEVTRLKRVAYGGLALGTLAAGDFREVKEVELAQAFPGIFAAPKPR